MLKSGLVSVSFRDYSCEDIIYNMKKCGLYAVEWGSDVHIKPGDCQRCADVYRKTVNAGLTVSSYGTYYKLGLISDPEKQIREFYALIKNAKILNTDTVRIWAGTKASDSVSTSERKSLINEALRLSDEAEKHGIGISFECHPYTLTDNTASSLDLMRAVNRENVGMYWQPNQFKSFEYNINSVKSLLPYITNVHIFNWHNDEKKPLAESQNEWKKYLSYLASDGIDRYCLLEFMPDNNIENLGTEADTLNSMI